MQDIQVRSGTNIVVSSASGMPPGIYPGRKNKVVGYERQRYQAYLQVAQPWIAVLKQRQEEVARGQARPGCIGEDVLTCMATLARVLAVATDFHNLEINAVNGTPSISAGDPLLQQLKTAVDGKMIFDKTLRFSAYIPGQDEGILPHGISIWVDLDSTRRIKRMSASLPYNPLGAHTEQEYDKTGIFELVTATSVQPCDLRKIDLYRKFEAELKPGLRPSHNIDVDMSSASETYGQSGRLEICGRSVSFYSFHGVSTDLISSHNMSGSYGGGSLQFE
jgi:hypothetical protein